ncbi:hypothetical protein [Sphingomonas immobilis]|uniref:DUF4349 domain-containing protein n=1 Tax=Sphingomonas immobilis TaxID=3063997 RepID=A0ABT8ZZB2_9SPHN|nr:hypothetical protein [Sphingomonas sp. CA1-15]MDO7842922.1 hypothetical protein [Sphingomonas sp. CA1-15]
MRFRIAPGFALVGLLVVGACSPKPDDSRQTEKINTYDVAESRAPPPADAVSPSAMVAGAPGISVTAAPGVAFNYHYSFRQPPAKIAAAQEAHAQACEKLGIARCRITGMRYSLVGEDRVEAMLAFKLDPTIARNFGKEGIAAIEKAEGMLIDAEITGTDAGAQITRGEQTRASLADQIASLKAELAKPGLKSAERADLSARLTELQRQAAATKANVEDAKDSLATTPMVFDYHSGTVIRGFDGRSPFANALDTAINSAQTTLAVVLQLIAVLAAPVLLLVLLLLLWLYAIRPLIPRKTGALPDVAPPTPPAV